MNRPLPLLSRQDSQRLAQSHANEIVLFDGADLLNVFDWARVRFHTRNRAGLIVTSHKREILPPVFRCSTSPELLARIVSQLLDRTVSDETVGHLFHRHGGNIREALRDLYDADSITKFTHH